VQSGEVQSGVVLRFSLDERLAAAAGGVTRYLADTAGMEADAVAKLQAATLAVCAAASAPLANSGQDLSVEVNRYADRIEVTITYPGATPAKIGALAGVDRIDVEPINGGTVLLVKNLQT
jgi:hypothetical protein